MAGEGRENIREPLTPKVPDTYLHDLLKQLSSVCAAPVIKTLMNPDCDEAPECTPIFWISRWMDYSEKYGIGYQLSDKSVGVYFNDCTKIVLDAAESNLAYIDDHEREHYFSLGGHPNELEKKVKLLKKFQSYMNQNLESTGSKRARKESDDLARLPVLRTFTSTSSAVVMLLSNGTLQMNYFEDHTKVIFCPLMKAVTYIDTEKKFHVYKYHHLMASGVDRMLHERIQSGKQVVEKLVSKFT